MTSVIDTMYVCKDFNTLCTELGVQCLVTMNPITYKLYYLFQNLGKQTVAIFTDEWFREVPPGMETLISMPSDDSPWMAPWPYIPRGSHAEAFVLRQLKQAGFAEL